MVPQLNLRLGLCFGCQRARLEEHPILETVWLLKSKEPPRGVEGGMEGIAR